MRSRQLPKALSSQDVTNAAEEMKPSDLCIELRRDLRPFVVRITLGFSDELDSFVINGVIQVSNETNVF